MVEKFLVFFFLKSFRRLKKIIFELNYCEKPFAEKDEITISDVMIKSLNGAKWNFFLGLL